MIALITIFLSAGKAIATEISITDNGSGSSSEANVSSQTQTTVEQTNNAEVSNNVSSNANTGNNEANHNSGEVNIQTGEAKSTTEVKNEVNTSRVTQDCCPNPSSAPSSVTITGNGADSTNTANASQNSTTTVLVTNNATVTTVINSTANTGKNKAEHNEGNVTIYTGNAKVTGEIINKDINNATVSLASSSQSDFMIKVAHNGAGSVNTVSKNTSNNVNVLVQNNADILNVTNWFANTGLNSTSYNLGDVTIVTGMATVDALIKNVGINTSKVEINCGCDNETPPPPPCTQNCGGGCTENCGGSNPGTPGGGGNGGGGGGNGGGGGGGGNGSGGSVLGVGNGGNILPDTGSMLSMWLTMIAFLLFFSGLVLKSRSGRSPNFSLSAV